jgi:hypothetical protein
MRKLMLAFSSLSLLSIISCSYDQLEMVEACDNSLVLSIVEQTSSSCGLASGAITAAITGETSEGAVTFSLNGVDFQESTSFNDLAAGSYSLTSRQGACTAMLDVIVENSEGLNATASIVDSDCGSASGEITLSTSDATGAVSFSINGGPSQPAATFSGLAPGVYEISVSDEIGCVVTLEETILSTVAFAEIQAIVTSTCAVSGCHAGNVSPDFRVRANILGRAGRIAARAGNLTMPPASSGSSLTQVEIDAISCWVSDGAPE